MFSLMVRRAVPCRFADPALFIGTRIECNRLRIRSFTAQLAPSPKKEFPEKIPDTPEACGYESKNDCKSIVRPGTLVRKLQNERLQLLSLVQDTKIG